MDNNMKLYNSRTTKKELQGIIDKLQLAVEAKDEEIARLKAGEASENKLTFSEQFQERIVVQDSSGFEFQPEKRNPILDECRVARQESYEKIVASDPELQAKEEASREDYFSNPAYRREYERRRCDEYNKRSLGERIQLWLRRLINKIRRSPNCEDYGQLISHSS